jgi:hypothetical protein
LEPEPAEEQQHQPQAQRRRRNAAYDGQPASPTARGVGEDRVPDDGGRPVWSSMHD